jgi:hypothetical protein
MKPSFWRALESLGATGSALCDWRTHLGTDWDRSDQFLKRTGRMAKCVIDPDHPPRRLDLIVDGEEDFVAVGDDWSVPPIPIKAADAVEIQPHWEPIGRALANCIGFDYGAWEMAGCLRRIGSCQNPFGHVSPVLLFLPPGQLGDYHRLFRDLAARTDSTVLFPSGRWFTEEMESLRDRNRLEFVDLSQRLAQIEDQPTRRMPLPTLIKSRHSDQSSPRAVIYAGNGLTWSQVTIELTGNLTIRLTAAGQDGCYSFSKRNQLGPEHPLGILMALAAKGQWRNPPVSSPDYERVSKAFQRLQNLLRTLVPLPDKPFRKSANFFLPAFKIRIHPKLLNDADKVNY